MIRHRQAMTKLTTLTTEIQMPEVPPAHQPGNQGAELAIPPNPFGLGPVDTIPEVLTRLDAIQRYAEASSQRKQQDGLASFNFLYRIITGEVLKKVGTGFFGDDEFLIRLDVAFANRYLDALRAWDSRSDDPPRSWKVLFERREHPRITPMQFAVAGVNAHVNYDLACAVVDTCEALGRKPDSGVQEEAYDKVNDIFAEQMEDLRQRFEGRLALWIDENVLLQVDDMLGNWTVKASREHAWNLARLLWKVRRFDAVENLTLEVQDRSSGLAGHLLLLPVP